MLRVTVDLFSGRMNPTWIIIDDKKANELLREISKNREIISRPGAGFQGLGYRGIIFEVFHDEAEKDFSLPSVFTITNGREEGHQIAMGIAERVIQDMPEHTGIVLPEHAHTPLDTELKKLLLETLRRYDRERPKIVENPSIKLVRRTRITVGDPECENCRYEESRYNPGFWNNDSYVLRNNNCYNYSRNWRTNTFAQPGKAHGCYPYPMACPDVTNAALCDGLKRRCDCLSDDEYPRRLMALVVGPGYDYHWYRKQIGGFWGHKPGGTPAKNIDNSGVVITDPRTCDRGPYTDFCGFFYAGKSVTII